MSEDLTEKNQVLQTWYTKVKCDLPENEHANTKAFLIK